MPGPTPTGKNKQGLHVHMGAGGHAYEVLISLAKAGKLAGATIINGYGLANALVSFGVQYVVHRDVDGAGDAGPWTDGVEGDIEIGRQWWRDGRNQRTHANLDPRVYIQLYGLNEKNTGADGYFYLGAMQEADKQNRKLAIFADSVGNPGMLRMADGSWVSPAWTHRVKSGCMRYGKAHGHLACLHEYGRMVGMKETTDPGSAIWPDGHRDDVAWLWFGGGRHAVMYENLIPADSRMDIFVGECGASAANLHGEAFVSDFKNYQVRYGADPYVVAFAYWTLGAMGLGFDYSMFSDQDMDLLASRL